MEYPRKTPLFAKITAMVFKLTFTGNKEQNKHF